MRPDLPRSLKALLAGALIAASMSNAPAQVPTAPAGGLNPAKLPDVVGIHLGMNVSQALAIVKAKYPAANTLFYTKFKDTRDAPWISRVNGKLSGTGVNAANIVDEVTVFFSAPPNPQVVVRVERAVQIIPPTTIGNLEASLFQKYGPTLVQKSIRANLSWEFDEEGRATPAPGSYICGSFAQPAAAMMGGPAQAAELQYGASFSPPVDTQISKMVAACPDKITIVTLLDPNPTNPNQLVSTLTVSLIDHAEDLRDFLATSKYGESATAAAANAAQRALEKNAAPKL